MEEYEQQQQQQEQSKVIAKHLEEFMKVSFFPSFVCFLVLLFLRGGHAAESAAYANDKVFV